MRILLKGLDEEHCVNRCISDFHNEEFVDQIIVIDGGSNDYTVPELKKFSKVKVFVHPWIDSYHDMEVCQSNIALSYIPNDSLVFILDFDERMSADLKKYLLEVNSEGISHGKAVSISRKTVDVFRYENSPHAIIGDDGWPIESNQIGQYPDYQCRLLRKTPTMHWVNSPHHALVGYSSADNITADIIHYEKDDYRDRLRIEKKWLRHQLRRQKLGLPADIFECKPKLEVIEFADGEYWK
jgi:glycosyltransferase involved in cell wall biosynthesis